jgi:hypothetical protein
MKYIGILKKWWTLHAATIILIVSFFAPSLEAYRHAHPAGFFGTLIGLVLGHLLKSPRQ